MFENKEGGVARANFFWLPHLLLASAMAAYCLCMLQTQLSVAVAAGVAVFFASDDVFVFIFRGGRSLFIYCFALAALGAWLTSDLLKLIFPAQRYFGFWRVFLVIWLGSATGLAVLLLPKALLSRMELYLNRAVYGG